MMFAKCSIVSQNIVYSIIIVAGMLFISLSLQIVSILAGLKLIVYPILITKIQTIHKPFKRQFYIR